MHKHSVAFWLKHALLMNELRLGFEHRDGLIIDQERAAALGRFGLRTPDLFLLAAHLLLPLTPPRPVGTMRTAGRAGVAWPPVAPGQLPACRRAASMG